MSKEKTSKIDIKINLKKGSNIQTNDINLISKSVFESISPALENISLINKTLESHKINSEYIERLNKSMKDTVKAANQLREIYQEIMESVQPLIDVISNIKFPKINIDFNELKIYIYRIEFKEKEALVNKLYNQTIFPPILYIIENNIKENSIENWEKWILNNKELKLFYIDRIDKWKAKYSDDNIKRMIDEIKFNFEHSNSYSVCTLIFVLIEKVFEPINIKKLYVRFIEENLYTSTDKAKEFSRHMAHGDRIEFGNMKSAMNMIFIYDFLQDVMIIK